MPAGGKSEQAASYEVRGVVGSVEPARGRAVIAHEEIPGYMPAMTMEFAAADPAELRGIEPGDMLAFTLRVTDRESRIGHIRKTGRTTVPVSAPAVNGPSVGAPLPDVALVDDAGRAFRLAEMKGRVLAITFIFSRCPLPDFCPRMNAHFAAAQRELAGGHFRFLSVSIDPAHDTPAVLAEYAKGFRGGATTWTFATGDLAEIRKLASFGGLEIQGDGAAITHNLRTIVIGPDGRVTRVFPGNEWQPADLTAAMKAAAR